MVSLEEVALIVNQRGVAGEVYGESRRTDIERLETPSLEDLDLTIEQALAAAGYLFSDAADTTSPVNALKLYRAIRDLEPTHPAASSREAWLLFQSRLTGAQELIDATVAANPDDPEPLFTRASISFASGNGPIACADLDTLLALPDVDQGFAAAATEFSQDFC